MGNQHMHFIAFDVPYPPDYGGIIDVFYHLKSLHQLGLKITLHCYFYAGNNPPNKKLEAYCTQVHYYHRKKHAGKLLGSKLPFIVATRSDNKLLENLLKDDHPILFSGLQTCFLLDHPQLQKRQKVVRVHNIEHDYYRGLAAVESQYIKKQYFLWEAKKLEKFEAILNNASQILSIAKKDVTHFRQYAYTCHIPPFYNSGLIHFKPKPISDSPYGFFHGNLSVVENINAVLFIIEKIANRTSYPIIIAGKNPSKSLQEKIQECNNVTLYASPDENQMQKLMVNAQVHLLFTDQQTGIKLKLMHSLSVGKHIIINSKMDDEGLFAKLCAVLDEPDEILQKFEELMETPFDLKDFERRENLFKATFNNEQGALRTKESLF